MWVSKGRYYEITERLRLLEECTKDLAKWYDGIEIGASRVRLHVPDTTNRSAWWDRMSGSQVSLDKVITALLEHCDLELTPPSKTPVKVQKKSKK